jgi:hypothetical protein
VERSNNGNDNALLTQNNFYPALLAVAERAWKGGGDKYIQENGVQLNPSQSDFPDFERRLLFHKNNYLKNEPIAYVKTGGCQLESYRRISKFRQSYGLLPSGESVVRHIFIRREKL